MMILFWRLLVSKMIDRADEALTNPRAPWNLPDEEANTISGLIINESRSFPTKGQIFQFYGFKFEILDIYKNTISKIRISSLN